MAVTTLFETRERLAADLSTIEGIKRLYDTIAELVPEAPDLPCFVLDTQQPFFTTRGGAVGQTEDTLHLNLTFLYKAQNQGKQAENIQAIERYVMLTKNKLYANFTGGGLYLINKDAGAGQPLDFTGYLFGVDNAPDGAKFWGFTVTLDVTMFNETAMSAGS